LQSGKPLNFMRMGLRGAWPQYLSNNVLSLRLQAAEMRLRRSPLSVSLLFFADEVGKNNRETMVFGDTVPTPLAARKGHGDTPQAHFCGVQPQLRPVI
jgi:hypothetical protein